MFCIRQIIRRLAQYPVIMEKSKNLAVFSQHLDNNMFSFSFYLDCPEPKISRQFNMARSNDETMDGFMHRLRENLKKVVSKKNKKAKKKPGDVSNAIEEPILPICFVKNSSEIEVQNCDKAKDFLGQEGLQVKILSEVFDIVVDPPMVLALKLPETILAGFFVYPFKIELSFAEQKDCVFSWYVSEPDFEPSDANDSLKAESYKTATWNYRQKGFFFNVSNEDVNRYIKLEILPRNGAKEGLKFESYSKVKVSAGPGKCPFEDRHAFTCDKTDKNSIRVLTYNLLADLYADSDFSRTQLHPQCPPYALEIAYRKSLFMKELIGYNADIMCLEEVDRKVFQHDLNPVFEVRGYEGDFCVKGGQVSEGLACFWNTKKFRKLSSKRTAFTDAVVSDELFKDILEVLDTNEQLKARFLRRTTALQTIVLDSKVCDSGLVVGVTHLYYKPDADHIRLLQIAMVIKELEMAKKSAEETFGKTFSVMLCGDFNSTPPFGVLDFIRNKVINEDHPDWKSAENEHVKNLKIQHEFHMDSACGTPQYTTYTIGFKDCLDYIFYETDKFEVTQVVPFPTEEEMSVHQGLPNVVFPSDHIACIADLKWK